MKKKSLKNENIGLFKLKRMSFKTGYKSHSKLEKKLRILEIGAFSTTENYNFNR